MKGLSLKLPRLDDLVSGSFGDVCDHGQTSNPGTPEGWLALGFLSHHVPSPPLASLCSLFKGFLHPTNPTHLLPFSPQLLAYFPVTPAFSHCCFNSYIYVYMCQETWRPEEGIASHWSAPRSRGHLAYDLTCVSAFVSTECHLNNPSLSLSVQWKAGIFPQLPWALALRNSRPGEASLRTEDTPPHLIVPICTGPPQAYHLPCLSLSSQ